MGRSGITNMKGRVVSSKDVTRNMENPFFGMDRREGDDHVKQDAARV